jgi:hypothetical protein
MVPKSRIHPGYLPPKQIRVSLGFHLLLPCLSPVACNLHGPVLYNPFFFFSTSESTDLFSDSFSHRCILTSTLFHLINQKPERIPPSRVTHARRVSLVVDERNFYFYYFYFYYFKFPPPPLPFVIVGSVICDVIDVKISQRWSFYFYFYYYSPRKNHFRRQFCPLLFFSFFIVINDIHPMSLAFFFFFSVMISSPIPPTRFL